MINNRWIIDDFHRLSIGFSDLLVDWIGYRNRLPKFRSIGLDYRLDWQPWL